MEVIPSPYVMQDELQTISGRVRKSKQIEWLKSKRIKFTTNAYGQPIVLRSHLEAVLSDERNKRSIEPNWAALQAS
jgi:Domain of unknown function (DUF4224)